MPARRFGAVLEAVWNSRATHLAVPFEVVKVYGTRARVPVRGTIKRA